MSTFLEVVKWLKIGLSDHQIRSFDTYYERIESERNFTGLTSLRDRDAIERRHFGESLALLQALGTLGPIQEPVIDIGAGAGFPAVPMKIARPALSVTLLEANGKKADFLQRLAADLDLADVTVLNLRAEEAGRDPSHRENYGLALARAVAPLRVLVELALPFLKIGALLATPKGSAAPREIREASNALSECGGELLSAEPLTLPWPGPTPTLVLVRKMTETPDRYPRRPGIPAKRPL